MGKVHIWWIPDTGCVREPIRDGVYLYKDTIIILIPT